MYIYVGIEENCLKSKDHGCLQESEQGLPNYFHQPLEAQSEPESNMEAESYSIIVKWTHIYNEGSVTDLTGVLLHPTARNASPSGVIEPR